MMKYTRGNESRPSGGLSQACPGLQKPGYIAHMWAYTERLQRTQKGERKGKEREGKGKGRERKERKEEKERKKKGKEKGKRKKG